MTSVPNERPLRWATHLALGHLTDPNKLIRTICARQLLLCCIAAYEPRAVQSLWNDVLPILDTLPPPSYHAPFVSRQAADLRAELSDLGKAWMARWNIGSNPQYWGMPAVVETAHRWAEARRSGALGDELTDDYTGLWDPDFLSLDVASSLWAGGFLAGASLEALNAIHWLHPRHSLAVFPIGNQNVAHNPTREIGREAARRIRVALRQQTGGPRLSNKEAADLAYHMDEVTALVISGGASKVGQRAIRPDHRSFAWLVFWQVQRSSLVEIATAERERGNLVTEEVVRKAAHRAADLAHFPIQRLPPHYTT